MNIKQKLNYVLFDKKLSLSAKGLLLCMETLNQNEGLNKKNLQKICKEHTSAINKYSNELLKYLGDNSHD